MGLFDFLRKPQPARDPAAVYAEAQAAETEDLARACELYRSLPADYADAAAKLSELDPWAQISGTYTGSNEFSGKTYYHTVEITVYRKGENFCVKGTHSGYTSKLLPESVLEYTTFENYRYEFSFRIPGNPADTKIYISPQELKQYYNGHFNYILKKQKTHR